MADHLTCGWSNGPQEGDWCTERATIVFLVQAHDVPLWSVDSEPKTMALPLCPAHTPQQAHGED